MRDGHLTVPSGQASPRPWTVGFPDAGVRASCMSALPAWVPVVSPDAGFAFGAVVAMADTRGIAERIVSAVNGWDALRGERDRLRAALHVIAYEPIGHPEASVQTVYDDIVAIARAALGSGRPSAPEEET